MYDENFTSGKKKQAAARRAAIDKAMEKKSKWSAKDVMWSFLLYENGTYGVSTGHVPDMMPKEQCFDVLVRTR